VTTSQKKKSSDIRWAIMIYKEKVDLDFSCFSTSVIAHSISLKSMSFESTFFELIFFTKPFSPTFARKFFDSSGTHHFHQFRGSWASHPQKSSRATCPCSSTFFINYWGVTGLEEVEAGPVPVLFVAVTVNV